MTKFYLKTSKNSYKLKDFLPKLNNYFLNSRIRQIHLLVMFKNRWKNKPDLNSCTSTFRNIFLKDFFLWSYQFAPRMILAPTWQPLMSLGGQRWWPRFRCPSTAGDSTPGGPWYGQTRNQACQCLQNTNTKIWRIPWQEMHRCLLSTEFPTDAIISIGSLYF